ncbi:TPA: rRNA processing protein [Enterococcus faecium]
MTNYDGEKHKRLRRSMAPKTEEEVALAGTNSGETEDKEESLAGTNSGETENKETALSGSNSVEEETKPNEPNHFEKDIEKAVEDVKEKFEELTSKNKHDHH